jgi:DNA modification methylase
VTVRIINADVMEGLRQLPDESVHCVVTSPPYWGLRNYNMDGQIGLEATIWEHIERLVAVFDEVRRVLRKDGVAFVNYGDAYAGSWGAQSRGDVSLDRSTLNGGQIYAAPKGTHTGSSKKTPGLKPKDRMLLPARLAIALCDAGWWLRDEIIWHKPNPMPSPGRGRTTPAHEMVYMLTRSAQYAFDQDAYREPASVSDWNDGSRVYGGINKAGANAQHGERTTGRRTGKLKVPGGWDTGAGGHGTINRNGRTSAQYVEAASSEFRNKRSVWTIATTPYEEGHFATFPPSLIEPMIKAGCPDGGTVLDPFGGAGTTGLVADRLQRNAVLIELNPEYAAMAERRIKGDRGELLELMEAAQ